MYYSLFQLVVMCTSDINKYSFPPFTHSHSHTHTHTHTLTLTHLHSHTYTLTLTHSHSLTPAVVSDYAKPAVLFVFFLSAVSPILKTLTESISTDTIWAMTVRGSSFQPLCLASVSLPCLHVHVYMHHLKMCLMSQVGMLLVHLLFFNYGSEGAMWV